MIRTTALFASVFLLWGTAGVAQYWAKPAASPGVDVPCTGCYGTAKGKLTPGYPNTIQTFTGRYLDSEATQDYQQPFKTARAENVLAIPSLHRIYMQIGSALFVYDMNTFFTRLTANETLMSVNSIPVSANYGPHPPPVDMVLRYDEFFYAENEPENGWTAPNFDGQRRLQAYDVDDQGNVYVAYSPFGWGIVKDDLQTTTPHLMQSVHQNYFPYNDDVSPFGIAVIKTTDGRYLAIIMSGNGPNNLYDVTNRVTPTHLTSFNKYVVNYAKNATMDRIAISSGTDISIYSADTIANGNWTPLVKFSTAGGQMNGIASDGTNFYATSDSGPGGLTISKFSPSGASYTRTDYPLGGTFMTTYKMAYGDGYLTVAGTTGAATLRVFRLQNGAPVEIDLKNYIQNYYFLSPGAQYTHPNFMQFFPSLTNGNLCQVVKANNHTYLIVTAWGLGDVYELPNADGIVVNNLNTVGTANSKIPAGVSSAGPFYGDTVAFKAVTGATTPISVTWDFGDGSTAPGTTGTQINHQFAGTSAGTTLARTVRATSISDSSMTSTTAVSLLKPTPRFGISDKFLFVQPNASSPAPIVVGDSFFDASDGMVESHANTWVIDGVTTSTLPPGAVPVGVCGTHSLSFSATYGPAASPVTFTIAPFNYAVRPFAAAVDVGSTDSQGITFISTSRATSDVTALPSAALSYKWELVDANNSVILAGPTGSAAVAAIPSFLVSKQTFGGRQNLRAHLTLTAGSVGASCAGFTSSEAFSRALNAPDPVINGGCTNGGPPCTFTVGSSSNVDQVADGWTYSWSVSPATANPTSGTGSTFSPTFTAVGTYTVSLTATNAVASTPVQKTQVVNTAGSTCSPIVPGLSIFVGFNQAGSSCTQVGGTCTAGVPVNFTVGTFNYSLDCGAHTYSWNFGDGTTSSSKNVSHTYAGNGTYNVTLVVTPPSGVPVTSTANVNVGGIVNPPPPPPPPPPSGGCNPIIPGTSIFIGYNQSNSTCTQIGGSCNAGTPINFTAGTYNYSFGCGTHFFNWNFGDGTTSTQQDPQHTYASNGTYNVTLNVTTPSAGTVPVTASVAVGSGGPPPPPPPPPPTGGCSPVTNGVTFFVTFNGPTSGCTYLSGTCRSDETLAFAANAYNYDFGCTTHTFSWNFGDGQTATGKTPTHRFVNAGTYNVTLTIGANGQSYPATATVRVTGSSPAQPVTTAFDFITAPIPGVPNGYVFTAQALGSTSSASQTYRWDYGDGHSDVTNIPYTTHIYADSKSYTVSLSVDGYSGSIQHIPTGTSRRRSVHH